MNEESVKVLVAQSCPTLYNPWTAAHQAPLSLRFSRQGHWSGLPCPHPGDLPNPVVKPVSLVSPALADAWEAHVYVPCLLHWQTGSSLLSCLGSPCVRRASAPLHVLHPYALSQDAEYSSLGSPVGPYSLSVLYTIICIC